MNPNPPDLLQPSRLDIRLLPARERFELWRASMAPLFDLAPTARPEIEHFAAAATVYHLGDLLLAEAWTRGACLWQGNRQSRRQTPDLLMLQLQTAGEGLAVSGHLDLHIQPGTLTLVDLAEPYLSEDEGFSCLSLIVPRAILAPRLTAPLPPGGLMLPAGHALGVILAAHLRTLWNTLPAINRDDLPLVTDTLLDMVVNTFSNVQRQAPYPAAGQRKLPELLAYIDQHAHEPLDTERLCKQFGYSRSAIYRLFAPYHGVGAYLRQRRLAGCYRELRSPFRPASSLAKIAQRWGFADHSHLTRQFRQTFGVSPSQVRQRAQANLQASATPDQALGLPHYHDWLMQL
jgi:AraC-like DNA-binding protein